MPHSHRFYNRYRKQILDILALLGPILIAQLTVVGMSFVDTVMAGNVGFTDLAAVAVAASFVNPITLLMQGILLALTPLIAYQVGAKLTNRTANTVHQGVYLAIAMTILSWLALAYSPELFSYLEIEPELEAMARQYLVFYSYGLPAFALYHVLRCLNEAYSNLKAIMLIGVFALLLNIPLNYIFINGLMGAPKLGGAGCGIATALVYWFMFIALFVYVQRSSKFKSLNLLSHWNPPQITKLKKILGIGLPIGASIFFEVSLFSTIALLLAPLGADVVASHQIALNFTSMVFMLPLSIGISVTILVGNKLGEQDHKGAKHAAWTGIGMCASFAICSAILTVLFRHHIVDWYTDDSHVAVVAASLMLMAASYQLPDFLQVVAAGALRGYQDTKYVMMVTMLSFWPLGLGIGSILAFTDWVTSEPMGVYGFWVAMIIALTCCCLSLVVRLRKISNLTDPLAAHQQ
ncbi:MATE family efflux transporter [Alginatibacterium sediminis]|uniref:Multidrug-efflux transporter n=1 Tax=Alginatibacterium sediminis TaxID=2164068 RepID=A0A420EHA4_9ALTE|nr:MATE family efflux transporter [Alginatibacterium sediminis]RKF20048.1 MATE family efflux transporter [Alginatibacterium sediminis]